MQNEKVHKIANCPKNIPDTQNIAPAAVNKLDEVGKSKCKPSADKSARTKITVIRFSGRAKPIVKTAPAHARWIRKQLYQPDQN